MKSLRQALWGIPLLLLAMALLLPSAAARSQSELENALKQYSGDAVKGYIQPVADLFGANMNSGVYHSAAIPKWGFHLSFDIVGMAAMVGDDQKTYMANTPAGFNPATVQTATVFGGKGVEASYGNTGMKYKVGSDGVFNTTVFPLAAPQLNIGYIYGTEASIRFITSPKIGDNQVPKITLWGIGARHSISQYLPMVPLDLSAGFFYSSFTAGDMINFKGLSIGAQVSKSWTVFTLYGGLAYEKSTLNLSYTSTDPTVPYAVDVNLEGANTFRGTMGLNITLGFLSLFADANFGSITCYSGGIGFGY